MDNQSHIEAKKVFSRIGFALVASVLAVNVIQLLVAGVMVMMDPNLLLTGWANFFLIAISFYLVGFPLIYFMVRHIPVSPLIESTKISVLKLVEYGLMSYAVMIVFNFLTILLIQFIELLKAKPVVNPIEQVVTTGNTWLTILCVVIISPIIEEIIFRKVLLDRIRPYGDKIAILFTAVAFGLYHGNLSQFVYATALGCIFAYLALNTNRLRYPIILHMFVNAMGSVIVPFLIGDATDFNRMQITSLLVVVMITIGTILLIKNRKQFVFNEASLKIPEEKVLKIVWLNRGMFAYLLLSICLIILVIFSI